MPAPERKAGLHHLWQHDLGSRYQQRPQHRDSWLVTSGDSWRCSAAACSWACGRAPGCAAAVRNLARLHTMPCRACEADLRLPQASREVEGQTTSVTTLVSCQHLPSVFCLPCHINSGNGLLTSCRVSAPSSLVSQPHCFFRWVEGKLGIRWPHSTGMLPFSSLTLPAGLLRASRMLASTAIHTGQACPVKATLHTERHYWKARNPLRQRPAPLQQSTKALASSEMETAHDQLACRLQGVLLSTTGARPTQVDNSTLDVDWRSP